MRDWRNTNVQRRCNTNNGMATHAWHSVDWDTAEIKAFEEHIIRERIWKPLWLDKENLQPGLWNEAKPDHLPLPVLQSLSLSLSLSLCYTAHFPILIMITHTNQQYHHLLFGCTSSKASVLTNWRSRNQKSLGIYSCWLWYEKVHKPDTINST